MLSHESHALDHAVRPELDPHRHTGLLEVTNVTNVIGIS